MAARLEAAAKQFGTQILVSGPMVSILSKNMRRQLRHIDTVTVKGSNIPVGYTFFKKNSTLLIVI
jgi:hypothetical protein